jgi:hypothetical protein
LCNLMTPARGSPLQHDDLSLSLSTRIATRRADLIRESGRRSKWDAYGVRANCDRHASNQMGEQLSHVVMTRFEL